MEEHPHGTKQWLRRAGIRPRKSWGQNFLINPRVAERILDRWSLSPGDRVLEVGAGAGSLTLPLLAQGMDVVAVERDARLCALLQRRAAAECPEGNLQVLPSSVLDVDPGQALSGFPDDAPRVLVGNLPYGETTPILEWAARYRDLFRWASFMVQREYGDRLMAAVGSAQYGSWTLWMKFRFLVEREISVGPGNFWPMPKVDSVLLRFTPREVAPVEVPAPETLEKVVRAAFSQRRKMLARPLAQGLDIPLVLVNEALEAAGIDAGKRAQECSLEEFAALSRAIAPHLRRPGFGPES